MVVEGVAAAHHEYGRDTAYMLVWHISSTALMGREQHNTISQIHRRLGVNMPMLQWLEIWRNSRKKSYIYREYMVVAK